MMFAYCGAMIAAQLEAAAREVQEFETMVAAAPEDARAGLRERRAAWLKLEREAMELAATRRHELAVAEASRPRGLLFALGAIFGVAIS